nr:hypothetical protein [Burkholderia sola]
MWQGCRASIRFSSMEDDGPTRRDGAHVIVFIGIIGRVMETALRDGIVHCTAAWPQTWLRRHRTSIDRRRAFGLRFAGRRHASHAGPGVFTSNVACT